MVDIWDVKMQLDGKASEKTTNGLCLAPRIQINQCKASEKTANG